MKKKICSPTLFDLAPDPPPAPYDPDGEVFGASVRLRRDYLAEDHICGLEEYRSVVRDEVLALRCSGGRGQGRYKVDGPYRATAACKYPGPADHESCVL